MTSAVRALSTPPSDHVVASGGARYTVFCGVAIVTAPDVPWADLLSEPPAAETRLPPPARALWDLRANRLTELRTEELLELVDLMAHLAAPTRGRQLALVVSGKAEFDMAELVVAYAEAAGYRAEFAVFRDDRSALEWLFGRIPSARLALRPVRQGARHTAL